MEPVARSATPELHRGYCPLDCPDACSLEIRVEDGRVAKLDGDRRNPVTAGFICTKVRHFPDRVYGPDRLHFPGIRVGAKGEGRFRRATWDEALELVAARMEAARAEHGGESILPYSYGGSNGVLSQGTTDARLFRRLGASHLARTLCAAETTRAAEALYGRMPGPAYEDFPEARLLVVWGANPSESSIHLVPYLLEAKARGARLVVLDPRAIPLARQADLHLAVRPGTDLPVALSLIRWLFESGRADRAFLAAHADGAEALAERARPWTFERAAAEAGVEAADLEAFARLYAEAAPALIRCGWGPERNRNGGSAIAAILALPAVAGKFGVRGGGYVLSNSGAFNLDASAAVAAEPSPARTLNMNRLGRILLEEAAPPVRVLFVYNCNPLATVPDQERVRAGLARDDLFTVVFEQVMTDTARYADVVLPATTFLEHAELSRGYGAMVIQRHGPLIAPVGEARSNHEVFAELCRRLGVARPGDREDVEAFAAAALAANGGAERTTAALAERGLAPAAVPRPVQMVDVRPRTPNGRIQLFPADLDAASPPGLYVYLPDPADGSGRLALISPATHHTVSSSLGELMARPATLAIHPRDAAARGIGDGDPVRIWNELGEVRCAARFAAEMRPGVVSLPKGLWSRHTANGATANALVPDTLGPLAGGACFNDARVEVERSSPPA